MLSDGQPHIIKDLEKDISSRAVSHIKHEVSKKLGKKSGIKIATSPRDPYKKAFYQLKKSPLQK